MTYNTKFEVNQPVYAILDNKIVHTRVMSINIKHSTRDEKPYAVYTIHNLEGDLTPIYENDIYETKEELVAALLASTIKLFTNL
jgi:hypothetical protein